MCATSAGRLYRGDPTIVFDFVGRKDAKTHGLAEDASKKLQGTIWIDEADRQVAHLEVSFDDNFRLVGGILATVQKGSSFRFDQAKVNGEIWLPTGAEGTVQARLLLLKNSAPAFSRARLRLSAIQGGDAAADERREDCAGEKSPEAVCCRLKCMFVRKLSIQRVDAAGMRHACPLHWIDNFAMRNFTNDAIFDDTLPLRRWADGGRPSCASRPAAAGHGGLVSAQGVYQGR